MFFRFISLFSFVLLQSFSAHSIEDISVQGLLGFTNGAVNIGADVDWQIQREHSLGGYFLFGTEKDNVRSGFWSIGGDVKVYFGPDKWKLYLAPGFGITNFELADGSGETTLGSLFKVGALLEVAMDMYFGADVAMFQNWFSDKAPSGFQVINATFRVDF